MHGVGVFMHSESVCCVCCNAMHTEPWAAQHNVEVHTVNAGVGVVLEPKINMLIDAISKVASLTEVTLANLVVCDLETTVDQIHGLLAPDGDVCGDLLVTTDAEGTHGVTCFVLDWGLVAQLVEHTDCLGQSVSSLADCNVDDHFVDLDLAHDIVLDPHDSYARSPCTLRLYYC